MVGALLLTLVLQPSVYRSLVTDLRHRACDAAR